MTQIMKITLVKSMLFLLLLTIGIAPMYGQGKPQPLTAKEKKEVVKSIGDLLNEHYIYEETANKMAEAISAKLTNGDYDKITDPVEFADLLGADLIAVSHDKHIRARVDPEWIMQTKETVSEADSLAFVKEQVGYAQMDNFGFKEVKILEGNVGYLNLTAFYDTEYGGETAAAAMTLLSNASALIVDLRQNGGGSPAMIQLISSYLFGPAPVHLNNFYTRSSTEPNQTWTLPHITGKRSPDIPVYVLTSKRTFSAAEEFSYNLKNMERATLIGETTGGGAHPGGTMAATERFTIWIPTGRAENPISKTNWEGTGVKPHIETPANEALDKAHMKAIEALMEKYKGGQMEEKLAWSLAGMKAKSNPITVSETVLKSYEGKYGQRILSLENGKLFYQREGRGKYELKAMTQDLFMIDEVPSFRLKILKEKGSVVALEGLYNNGRTDKSMKDKR
ncbi:MAG: hypothetical protein ACI8YQ_003409 [Polaribacter sp.]|jgi:hypothetical protein